MVNIRIINVRRVDYLFYIYYTGNEYKQFLANNVRDSFVLAPIGEAGILREIKYLAPNKALGPDNINDKLLKLDL